MHIPLQVSQRFMVRIPQKSLSFMSTIADRSFIYDEAFQEAIFLASPELYNKMELLTEDKLSIKEKERVFLALTRYATRMCSRSTPFGTFAGVAMGKFGNYSHISPSDKIIRKARLDTQYLGVILGEISRLETVRGLVKYFKNNTIYYLGEQIRYYEAYLDNNRKKVKISRTESTQYLIALLDYIKEGKSIKELESWLCNCFEVNDREAHEYVNLLIDSQVIISEVEIEVTGTDTLQKILETTSKIPELETLNFNLEEIDRILTSISESSPRDAIKNYKNIVTIAENIGYQFRSNQLLQCDILQCFDNCSINSNIIEVIKEGLLIMNYFSPSYKTNLSQYAAEIFKRYEFEEIPILELLDPDMGIPYQEHHSRNDNSYLLNNINFLGQQVTGLNIVWKTPNTLLLTKYFEFLKNNTKVIELKIEDLKSLGEPNWSDLPSTMQVTIKILARNDENSNETIVLTGTGTSTAANTLSRFCHLDSAILEHVQSIVSYDEGYQSDMIFAEIVHLPDSRMGNILIRPIMRHFEIPLYSNSSLDKNFVIPLDDCYVKTNGINIDLISKRLGKVIIPRLTSAHNYHNSSLPIYEFLGDLQYQNGRQGAIFNWGPLQKFLTHFPRVCYKNIILSLETWEISNFELLSIREIANEDQLIKEFSAWRIGKEIPTKVVLVFFDNELYLNLQDFTYISILLQQTKKLSSFTLTEFIGDEQADFVYNKTGKFVNEILLSVLRT